ncbi:MAG: phosphotransferase family protein [Microthrixaceae bacterium]
MTAKAAATKASDAIEPELDVREFQRRVASRWPNRHGVRIVDVHKFPRGVSRETWFVDVAWDGGSQRLVLRRDLPGGANIPTTLEFEYDVYRLLQDSSVPVAAVLWYDDDPLNGRPYYTRDLVEGSWEIPHFMDPDPKYDELRIECSKEHMRKLALLHTCDWEALGFGDILPVPPTPAAAPLTALDRIESMLSEFQIEAFPEATEALEVLRREAPTDVPCISLLKGTNGIGEEVWRDGEIVAMSDWELAYLGDPASDFAHVQRLKQKIYDADSNVIWSLDHAIDYYTEISGIHVDMERVRYYQRFDAFETLLYTHNSAVPLAAGTDLLVRRGWSSTEVLYSARRRLAETAGIL